MLVVFRAQLLHLGINRGLQLQDHARFEFQSNVVANILSLTIWQRAQAVKYTDA